MRRWLRRWLIGAAVVLAAGVSAVVFTARHFAKEYEPRIREQAVAWLEKRFNSDVELEDLRITLPKLSPLKLYLTRGKGMLAHVEGKGLVLRFEGRRDIPPLFAIRSFRFDLDLGTLFSSPRTVPQVMLDGLEICIPPKGDRPRFRQNTPEGEKPGAAVEIGKVDIVNARLQILPKNPDKKPLDFAIRKLRLESVGSGQGGKYSAELTNPVPPGEITSHGSFGPWNGQVPGDSPLDGVYRFENADLGVFKAIAGTLTSTGKFSGSLSSINAGGEATVPNFRLKRAGNAVPLRVRFQVHVDGLNGNTTLKPVSATLGSTSFVTSGAVVRREKHGRRTIALDVSMPNGQIADMLRLATKGSPILEGRINLKAKILVPPLQGKVAEKLILDGKFELSQGHFREVHIQDQIDTLSRRGQGQPGNQSIDEVFARMRGAFHLENQAVAFQQLDFDVPGAEIALKGSYDLDDDVLDFHGTLKLVAKVSQTLSGWKRWAAKPIDPFFSRDGAGTFLRIQVTGSSKDPKFGRDKTSAK